MTENAVFKSILWEFTAFAYIKRNLKTNDKTDHKDGIIFANSAARIIKYLRIVVITNAKKKSNKIFSKFLYKQLELPPS